MIQYVEQYRIFAENIAAVLKQCRPFDAFTLMNAESPEPTYGECTGALYRDCDVLLSMGVVNSSLIAQLPHAKLIQTLSSGFETVDIENATLNGIWVAHAPADQTGNADAVAEFAVLEILAIMRDLSGAIGAVENATHRALDVAYSLAGKTVCLVGAGSVGKALAKRLDSFGCQIEVVSRTPREILQHIQVRPLANLPGTLRNADVVVLCLRSDANNRHFFSEELFSAMKMGAVFVNIARGALVDEEALGRAIGAGRVRAAALDVLEKEPASPQSAIVQLPETLVTPHVAAVTDTVVRGTASFINQTLSLFMRGTLCQSVLNKPAEPRWKLQS